MWYKNKILWVVVVVVLGWAVWHYAGNNDSSMNPGDDSSQTDNSAVDTVKAGEISVTGMLDCLPLVSGATPDASSCIVGIKGDDGKIYALNTSQVQSFDKGITQQSKVKAIGTYAAADTSSEEAKIYRYDGVLTVRVLGNNS